MPGYFLRRCFFSVPRLQNVKLHTKHWCVFCCLCAVVMLTLERALMIECGATLIAFVLVSASVNNKVALERTLTEEVFPSFGSTPLAVFQCENACVLSGAHPAERCTSHRTLARLLSTKPQQVQLETFLGQECLATLIAVCFGQQLRFCQGPIQVLQQS